MTTPKNLVEPSYPLRLITVLTPVFNEKDNLEAYCAVVENTLFVRKDVRVEVLFIDDGSTDASWSSLKSICGKSDRFRAIRLSRNFGPHAAIAAGLEAAEESAAIAILACDLQDPPEVVGAFIDRWKDGSQIVFGHRRVRNDSTFRTFVSKLILHFLRRSAMPRNSHIATGSFLLADRIVIDCYRVFREHNRITFAMMAWTGFTQDSVGYERVARTHGKSGWSYSKLLKASYDVFIGYSHLPIRLITIIGFSTFIGSLILIVYAVAVGLHGGSFPGWASSLTINACFFGTQFFLMSIVGEYLYRIYLEVVQRPLYFISEKSPKQ